MRCRIARRTRTLTFAWEARGALAGQAEGGASAGRAEGSGAMPGPHAGGGRSRTWHGAET